MIIIVPENLHLRVKSGTAALPAAVCAIQKMGFVTEIRAPGGQWKKISSMQRCRVRGAREFLIHLD